MAVSTLIATAGASNANTYVTLAVADQFHEDRPPSKTTWEDATNDEKNAAILWATQLLDALIVWSGTVIDGDQALLWPRNGMVYPSGYAVAMDIIPTELQNATAEYARQLLAADRAGDSDIETQGITSIKAGPVALTFKDSVYAKALPDAVYYLIPEDWYDYITGRAAMRDLLRA